MDGHLASLLGAWKDATMRSDPISALYEVYVCDKEWDGHFNIAKI